MSFEFVTSDQRIQFGTATARVLITIVEDEIVIVDNHWRLSESEPEAVTTGQGVNFTGGVFQSLIAVIED
ncbi:MAG TPA: hypothetical protein VGJ66_10090 [Pyrinomonadaceae bacterium]